MSDCGPKKGSGSGFTACSAQQLESSLTRCLIPVTDRVRDLKTQLGLRPYCISIVVVRWSGPRRGAGAVFTETETPLEPTPRLADLTGLQSISTPVGTDEVGQLLLSEISGRYTEDELMGRAPGGDDLDPNQQVFVEVLFPLSGSRRRFRMVSAPHYNAGALQWTVLLERAREDRDRRGDPR